jgi:KaiC/GvpD/RAD55 family RecA-like ATPase
VSTLLDLPREVYEFLRKPGPQSMVLRGPPGTGKTTLALALLENFPGRKILISTRVSHAELVREFPWIESGGEITAVDGEEIEQSLPEVARVFEGIGRVVVDAQNEPIVRGLWLPSPVKKAVERLVTGEPALVVIDSWDALIERYLGSRMGAPAPTPDRAELERMVLDLLVRGSVSLVLVLERAEPTVLDYLVNAVLETGWEVVDSRPERWLRLVKLRGVRVDSPLYPFSLEGGRFNCITSVDTTNAAGHGRFQPEPNAVAETLWPGSVDYANAFGRLLRHRLTLATRETTVPDYATRLLISPAVAHTLARGGRVAEVLPPGTLPQEVYASYADVLPLKEFVRQVRFLSAVPAPDLAEELQPTVLPLPDPRAPLNQPHAPELLKFLSEADPSRPALMVGWISGIRAVAAASGFAYTPETFPGIVLTYLMRCPIHAIYLGPDGDALTTALRPTASVRLRLQERHGRVFLYGEQPMTPSYVLTEGRERAPYRLLRMV